MSRLVIAFPTVNIEDSKALLKSLDGKCQCEVKLLYQWTDASEEISVPLELNRVCPDNVNLIVDSMKRLPSDEFSIGKVRDILMRDILANPAEYKYCLMIDDDFIFEKDSVIQAIGLIETAMSKDKLVGGISLTKGVFTGKPWRYGSLAKMWMDTGLLLNLDAFRQSSAGFDPTVKYQEEADMMLSLYLEGFSIYGAYINLTHVRRDEQYSLGKELDRRILIDKDKSVRTFRDKCVDLGYYKTGRGVGLKSIVHEKHSASRNLRLTSSEVVE